MLLTVLIGILVLLLLGFPLWMVFLAAPFVGLTVFGSIPSELVASTLFGSLNNFALLAVPGFIFAAVVMERGGMAQRLVDWMASLLGKVPGGLPLTTIAASEAFGAISGSSSATVAAVGKVLYPGLRKSGYGEPFSLGLITTMGAVASIIPPSITMILYGALAPASVGKLFLAGFLPGILVGICVMVYAVWYAVQNRVTSVAQWDIRVVLRSTRAVLWTLGAPLLIFGGIYGGYFTPTEASMVVSMYAVIVALLIHRDMNIRDLWDSVLESVYLTSKVFIIVAAASVFSLFLVIQNVPNTLVSMMHEMNLTPIMILAMINIIVLIAGMFMDPNSALIVLIPILLPIAAEVGVDVIHFGIIMTVNLAIGMFTPPFGLNIFVSSSVFNVPTTRLIRSVIPFTVAYLVALILITYIPAISLWLPELLQ